MCTSVECKRNKMLAQSLFERMEMVIMITCNWRKHGNEKGKHWVHVGLMQKQINQYTFFFSLAYVECEPNGLARMANAIWRFLAEFKNCCAITFSLESFEGRSVNGQTNNATAVQTMLKQKAIWTRFPNDLIMLMRSYCVDVGEILHPKIDGIIAWHNVCNFTKKYNSIFWVFLA